MSDKTLDEVIQVLEDQINDEMNCEYSDNWIVNKNDVADAIHYLKEYKNTDEFYKNAIAHVIEVVDHYEKMVADYLSVNNPPLTWDELKAMKMKPVWIEFLNSDNRWAIVRRVNDDVMNYTVVINEGFGYDAHILKDDYVRYCKAYRKERK